MLVKILGAIDLISSFVFLGFVFGTPASFQLTFFCAALLFVKGLFVFGGDILSVLDIFASVILLISIFFTLPSVILWIPAFLLLSKGVMSFI